MTISAAHLSTVRYTNWILGFEFYAPQTTLAEDGKRILIGWMGVPDGEEMLQPTRAQGWIHQMTCPRELRYRDGKLWQTPVRELEMLREEELHWQGNACDAPELDASRLEFELSAACAKLDFLRCAAPHGRWQWPASGTCQPANG